MESSLVWYAKLGWKNYTVNGTLDQFQLPETTLKELVQKSETDISEIYILCYR